MGNASHVPVNDAMFMKILQSQNNLKEKIKLKQMLNIN